MAQVLDLRGRQLVRDRTPVLLDPSGGRARVLAWVGRGVAVVFLVWLIGLVFAGLGLLPSSDLPFGRAFVGPSPPVLQSMPPITQAGFAGPSAAVQSVAASRFGDPTSSSGAAAGGSRSGGTAGATAGGGSGAQAGSGAPGSRGHGQGSTGATTGSGAGSGASGGSATATNGGGSTANNGLHAGGSGPGRTVSQSSPGHTKSSGTGPAAGSGSSSASSGHGHQTTTTATTPGKSGSAPGHAPLS
jgi:hypothetical protein